MFLLFCFGLSISANSSLLLFHFLAYLFGAIKFLYILFGAFAFSSILIGSI